MRILKTLFTVAITSLLLTACGGGDATVATAGAGGGTTSTTAEPALLTAYKKITVGMTFDQVQAIIGNGYSLQDNYGLGRRYSLWTQGVYKQPNSMTVQVAFNAGGGADNKYFQIIYADGTYGPQTCAITSKVPACEQW